MGSISAFSPKAGTSQPLYYAEVILVSSRNTAWLLLLWALVPVPIAAQEVKIEPLKSSITVTERIAAEAPASISVSEREEIRRTPGVNLDDRLRNVPGFSLFRRSSSVVAHPTTQGVSLRGIGPTGASRTLVLWDGVPLNDPFGGWVYWTRVAPEELERIEISRGASTSMFGDRAMGGAAALFSREPERWRLTGAYEGGNRNTHQASAGVSNLWPRWALSGAGRAFTTDGYHLIPEGSRGAIDRTAAVRFVSGDVRMDLLRGGDRMFLRADLLAEERANGTPLQRNSTGLGAVSGHYQRRDTVSALGYHTREEFRSAFTAIAVDRNSERPTFNQSVPAEATGGAALWNYRRAALHVLAGGDGRRVEGYSKDALFPAGQRIGGGSLVQHGAFTQFDIGAGPARLFLGARHDFTGLGRRFFSPSAGVVAGRGRWRGRFSAYRGFRAPTLNELFREFRVGNAVTRANPDLRPETLTGIEAGADLAGEASRASLTFYRSSLRDLVTNVTLSSSPALIVRQRQNAAAALARGAELDARRRWGPLGIELAYLFVDSRFRSGERIPHVPRHQGSGQLTFERGGTLAAAGLRSYSSQFEDERNGRDFLLPGFATVQFLVRRRISGGLSAMVAFENLLDREYVAGFTPARTLGAPRLWRAGLRWEGRLK